jgi:integrase
MQERMTKRGKVYDVVFRIVTLDGQEKQKKLSGYFTKTLAKEAYLQFVDEYCELVKRNPLKKKNPQKEDLIIGDLVRSYIATLGNQNKYSSIYDKNNIFRIYILSYYEKTKIQDLTVQELYRWQDELWNTKNPKTGNFFSYKYLIKIRSFFNAFLSWCEKRYACKNNFAFVEKPKRRQPKKEMSIWTRKEFEKFISVVDDPTYHALFTFMFFTGRRKGELFALTPKDVTPTQIKINKSLTRKTIDNTTYGITSTKADKVQNIPVCAIVQEEIKDYKGGNPFYFGGNKPLSDNTVRRAFLSYCKKANVEPIRIHDLRHSFVSMLIHLGANLIVVADLISDTVEQVTKTYGHLYQEDKLNILLKIK